MYYTIKQLTRYVSENNGLVFIDGIQYREDDLRRNNPNTILKAVKHNSICSIRLTTNYEST